MDYDLADMRGAFVLGAAWAKGTPVGDTGAIDAALIRWPYDKEMEGIKPTIRFGTLPQ